MSESLDFNPALPESRQFAATGGRRKRQYP